MKKSMYFFLLATLSTVRFVYADGLNVRMFYETLDAIVSKHDARQLINLLNSIEGSSFWRIGASGGPIDVDLLQCAAVNLFFNSESRCNIIQNVSKMTALKKWVDAFSAQPSDSDLIIRLLQDPKPAIRLIALRRLEGAKELDADIVKQLKILSANDLYVKIVQKPIWGSFNNPTFFIDDAITDVEFPLRKISRKILSNNGCVVKYDAVNEAVEGIHYFSILWMDNPQYRKDIECAISLLGRDSNAIKAIKKLSEKDDCATVYKVFRRKIEK